MKYILILLLAAVAQIAPAQSSATLAANLQAADPGNWPAINALLIAQRDELTAANTATLATASSTFSAQLIAAQSERDAALAKYTALQTQVTTVLQQQLTDLQTQLSAAQTANDATAIAATQARISTINALMIEAAKSDKQKALDAATAAKAAADAAVAAAQAALNTP